ncbi:MAG: Rap1a/Tai family immunity protein [Pseudomonadota bacterium]
MKRVSLLTGVCACLWLYGGQARAAYVTGDDLALSCLSDSPQKIFSCLNYVAGVIDYHTMMQSLGTATAVDFCLPESLPIERAAEAVVDYLKKSPQHDSFIAAPAVMMALQEAYPCGPVVTHKKKKKNVK